MQKRFIFQDPQGRRWPRLRLVLLLWAALVAGAMIWFAWSVFVRPQLALPLPIRQLKGQLKAAINLSERSPDDPNSMNWERFYEKSQASQERLTRIREQLHKPRKEQAEIRLGIYADWDANSFASLEEHAGALTHVAAPWFTLADAESNLIYEPDAKLVAYAASRGLVVMPILDNLEGNDWQPEAVENLANGPAERRKQFIAELVRDLRESKAGGVILNWEQVDPASKDAYTRLVTQLADALHDVDKELWFMVSMGDDFDTFDLDEMANSVDHFVAQFHDENSETDPPGPIASIPWLEGWLKVVTDTAGTDQWIGVLGAYAYDWNLTTKKTETIGYKDAMSRASYAGVDQAGQKVEVAAPAYNGMFDFFEDDEQHTIAFLDAISFYNQLLLVRGAKLGGLGINRLGSEDPQIWDLIEPRGRPQKPLLDSLGKLRATETVTHVGRGEIVTVDETRDDGTRTVTLESDGRLRANYTRFPTYPILYHQGAGEPHQVAITFDDGPDPTWTPKILDILKARGVKACFFVVGQNAEDHPGLVERIVREGHEIGNHTYNHANLALMSEMRMRLELNATESVIEAITGRSTTLFRPPYNADSTPTSIAELAPLKLAQDELGYTVVLEKVDPQDWAQPGTDTIVERVKDLRNEGNIVLLHDAGGDRSQTVAALPRIIDYLQTRGDSIVPLSDLLKISHDDLMPPVDANAQPVQHIVSGTGFRIWHAIIEFFWAFMIFATALVALRTLIVAWLAHRHHGKAEGRKSKAEGFTAAPPSSPSTPPPLTPLSIVIAAYNEGKVIAKTLRSVVTTDYTGGFEVLVVDDGSKDDTAAEVERIAADESRIRLIRQPNTGKSGALRNGVLHARHDLVVFLDADTLFERGTLSALVEPFVNPLVGAVSGHARVGNMRTFVARCQSLEYICGFNLDRRAFTEWNCITVVPGAISALRRSAIEAAEGFSHDTLAEDTDLTLTLHRLGYHIAYAPDAVAWTEAPETFATLAKQRFRWAFGTMQCLWKHRDLVFNPRFGALGWFSLPGIWFFQIALVALTPLVDALLIYSALFGHAAAIWYYMVAFVGMDLLLAALACHIEEEPLYTALWIIPMRVVYRPLLAWVIWKSIFRALKGALVGWGKLERTGAAVAGT